ncbi:DCC1-like thiol-disulfide oxidoreductase family protein [Streptomyces sp. NPDC047097]|uniref:thiol-disulfide oxidoreductase DCC family protein n=1 Tax=Streptomyces sp. NPDC047097 TaxID=3155260 RepID=UPI0033DBA7A0
MTHPAQPAPAPPPVRRLTVLYDARCPLCVQLRGWLARQRQRVPLDFVPAGSAEARHRFPRLDHRATLEEITVIGDAGQVYRSEAAWITCLWALDGYRATAHRLATPAGLPLARATVLAAARLRAARTGGNEPDGCAEGRCVPGHGGAPGRGWDRRGGPVPPPG